VIHTDEPEVAITPTSGDMCRLLSDCRPAELYYRLVAVSPLTGTAYVHTVEGATYRVPLHLLTTAPPRTCDSWHHASAHDRMIRAHVHRTYDIPIPDKKPRESAKDREARLKRWESALG
jgi:hypothetical protein